VNKVVLDYRIQQLRKSAPAVLLALVLILLGVYSVLNSNYEESYSVTGVVESLTGLPGNTGDKLYLMVRLEDGSLVRSRIQRSTLYNQGNVVELTAIEPRFFGRTVYKFRGYLETPFNKQ
jgi:hypothetical protein